MKQDNMVVVCGTYR